MVSTCDLVAVVQGMVVDVGVVANASLVFVAYGYDGANESVASSNVADVALVGELAGH